VNTVPAVRATGGGLRPIELASAAVLAGVAVVMAAVGSLLPHAGLLELMGAVPMAIVAQRHRIRATVAAGAAGSLIAFLAVGITASCSVVACAVMGGVVGMVQRRGHGAWTIFGLSLVLGPLSAAAIDLLLLLFTPLRQLAFTSVLSLVSGFTAALRLVPFCAGAAAGIDQFVGGVLASWWSWVFVGVVVFVSAAMLAVWWILSALLVRLSWVKVEDTLDAAPDAPGLAAAPLPMELRDVRLRYPGTGTDALNVIGLRLVSGQFVAVVGSNGSGKSTLLRILAGAAADSGTVHRAGAAGLGRIGGTALVMQRPETQVVGATVADDIVWGLPAWYEADVDRLLKDVGLEGMADRPTSDLSGGQLQRLAIASALAREPALLLSDESTAMVDSDGRASLLALLAELPRRYEMTVVHVTHSDTEAASADRVIRMASGSIVSDQLRSPATDALRPAGSPTSLTPPALRTPPTPPAGGGTMRLKAVVPPLVATSFPAGPAGPTPARPGTPPTQVCDTDQPVLRLRDVAHTHDYGTPWAHQALRRVNLDLYPGEGLLITGDNGSGKSTLAWVLAGLTRPTAGECLLDGRDVADQVGAVALAFQHARLQLQRPTVIEDIVAAAGRSTATPHAPESHALVADALEAVGLPAALATRHVDTLSGGQMRRVALAGLLASAPRVLVLDEPLAGLDPAGREHLVGTVAALRRSTNLSLIVISHDLDGLERACPRTVRLEGGVLA
jgi:energy-coupling factor transporter ATP-binding protein EcfA2